MSNKLFVWYRFSGTAGPGHTGGWTEYRYLPAMDGDEELLMDLAREIEPDWARDAGNGTCSFEALAILPFDVKQQFKTKYEKQLANAEFMLEVLRES